MIRQVRHASLYSTHYSTCTVWPSASELLGTIIFNVSLYFVHVLGRCFGKRLVPSEGDFLKLHWSFEQRQALKSSKQYLNFCETGYGHSQNEEVCVEVSFLDMSTLLFKIFVFECGFWKRCDMMSNSPHSKPLSQNEVLLEYFTPISWEIHQCG